MSLFKNPSWLEQFSFPYQRIEEVPEHIFEEINADLRRIQTGGEPLVSVVIAAWNEETNLLRCVASLAKTRFAHPIEIIAVNNNSKDHTQKTIDKLHIKGLFEQVQGCGPTRQLGQENAKGTFILTADADCIYPAHWVAEMINILAQPGVVCTYGRYSFIGEKKFPRWKLVVLEKLKDAMAEVRHFKQPYFNCFGISMGYIREYGVKIGFIKENRRGEDGQLCMDLMRYGKVKQVRSSDARVWTDVRTLEKEGNFSNVIFNRIKADLRRFKFNFIKRKQQ